MAMGTRQSEQGLLWVATAELPKSPGHPFYTRLNALLEAADFDRFVEEQCAKFYAPVMGRPSLAPGRYFRLLLVGYFEGIDSERGMAWRASDSLAVRSFLRLPVDEPPPDHSTISRTRRVIDLESHRAVFTWVQQRLVAAGLLRGKTVAVDATMLEANAAMRSIVRRDTGESYQEFLTGLAQASGIATPTREELARLDRKRKKKTSNQDWKYPGDPDAKIAQMKDGRTHLAHKAEHAVDLETGALVAVTLQDADQGDTTTIIETAIAAAEQIEHASRGANTPGAGRDHRGQGLSQQSDYDRAGSRRPPVVRGGAGPWSPRLVKGARSPDPGVCQSAADPWSARPAPDASTGRADRTLLRTSLRHRWDAPHASARPHQHPQAPTNSCGGLQSRARHAPPDRQRHAARAAGSPSDRHHHAYDAPGRYSMLAGRDFRMAPTHRGCALGSVTDHHHRQLLSADHFHHGLLSENARRMTFVSARSSASACTRRLLLVTS